MPVDKFGRMSDAKTRDTGVSLTYINNNYIRSDGGTPVYGSIDMRDNTLYNVSDPVNPQDVATKEYTDNIRGVKWVKRKQDGTYVIKKDLDMNDKRLKNISPPVDDADAVNKIYADTLTDETRRYVNMIVPFVNQQNQYTATNNINMRGFTLQNVGEPTNAGDVATKGYLDKSGGGAFEVKNGGYEAKGGIYLRKNKLGGLREPVQDGEAANKRYVDNYVEEYVNGYVEKFNYENDNFVLPWKVNMAGKKLSGLSLPSKSDEAATREYVNKVGNDVREYTDRSSELLGERFKRLQFAFLKDNGKFVAYTPISMASQPLKDLTEPKETSDAATKKYVDDVAKTLTLEEALTKENGVYNIANAYINMNFNNIKNIGEPGHISDAATKGYVDNSINDVLDKAVKQRTHLIMAHASYQGDLIKGKYQFTFGGVSVQTYKKHWKFDGFLMPHSGYIKRFVLEDFGSKFYYDSGDEKYTISTLIEKTYGFNVPVPFFTLVLNKTSGEWLDLGTLNIIFERGGFQPIITNYSFTTTLPNGLETYKINVKDVLNIRSELSSIRDLDLKVYYSNTFSKRNHIIDWDDINDQFYTYLTTILIELDPL